MRKLIIIAASIAALAIPTAAMATVAVDGTGTGFVGKGDVQTALGLANDQAMQDLFASTTPKGAAIKFTSSYTWALDNTMACMADVPGQLPVPTGDTIHVINGVKVTQAVSATANVNNADKLTNGWNLTGLVGPITYGSPTSETIGTCPAGSRATKTLSSVETKSAHSLYVNDKALPNTPVPTV
jgi:hypothetical protein